MFTDLGKLWKNFYNDGKIKAIGVSNFYPDRLIDLIEHNKVILAVNQVETHVFCQQIEASKLMKENKVQVESWGPFAEGKNNMFKNELLVSLAKKYNKSVAQIILKWLIQRDIVVIPKSVHKERIIENFNVFDFEIEKEDMEKISTLDTKKSLFLDHRDPETVK